MNFKMAARSKSEIDNFLFKFYQLKEAGFTAHLDLDTNAGQVWVGLRVMLGSNHQHQHQQQSFKKKKKNNRGPAYKRRQEKRQAKRAEKQVDAEEAAFEKADFEF